MSLVNLKCSDPVRNEAIVRISLFFDTLNPRFPMVRVAGTIFDR